jgi:membrane-associated protease RseP (regulator of RpoE activity)
VQAMYADERPLRLRDGLPFAASLLAILLTHEFGHFVAARVHRVNASLPLFIPLPVVSPFGTLGAVIVMRDRIRSRNALLDIGASGPIAGMVLAVPVLLYGLSHSEVTPLSPHGILEGQCLLYSLLKRLALGPIAAGYDVQLNSVAMAGWVGLLVTMMNLFPTGQLDGGHVAYALFGERQIRFAAVFRYGLLGLAGFNLLRYGVPAFRGAALSNGFWTTVGSASPWLIWFVVLTALRRMSNQEHPPTDPSKLSPGRRVVAIATLVLFVLLFMPTPMLTY